MHDRQVAVGPSVLSGLRVLDFGRYIAGPFCAAMLADLGADVIRIEWAGSNDDRHVMPVTAGGEGALFMQMNRGKRSLAMDMQHPKAPAVFRKLVAGADVVVANMSRRARARLGLDYEGLTAIRPDIVLTTVTAFGTGSAQADEVGFDGTGQAVSGAMFLTGSPKQPYRSAVSYVDYGTAMSAAFGTMAALMARQQTGLGQHVEASLVATALTMTNPMLIEEALGARSRVATENRSPIAGPSDLFAAKDGWVLAQVVGQDMFERWAAMVGADDLTDDPRFRTDIGRGQHGAVLSARMREWTERRTVEECLSGLRAARVPGCKMLSPAEALSAGPVAEGSYVHWGADGVPIVRPPASLSGERPWVPSPAPALGTHTGEVLRELGYSGADIADLVRDGCVDDGGQALTQPANGVAGHV